MYLKRLGLEMEPPSVEGLFRLHRAHAERVTYETLWIQLGDRWGIDQDSSMSRISSSRRGGYCFHLNGAFARLLDQLGYRGSLHVGGVHGPDGPGEEMMANHLVLTVSGLPTDANPGGVWYVDAGLGDAMHEPLPLLAGSYQQGPYHLRLEETPGGVGDWHLEHDPLGSFTGMSWKSEPVGIERFAERHQWLSTSAESGFVKFLTLQRRDADGADLLRGLVLKRNGSDAGERVIESEGDLFAVMGDVFGLDVALIPAGTRSSLWRRLHDAHEAWEASRRG